MVRDIELPLTGNPEDNKNGSENEEQTEASSDSIGLPGIVSICISLYAAYLAVSIICNRMPGYLKSCRCDEKF